MEISNELIQAVVNYLGKREEVMIFQTLVREIQVNNNMKGAEDASENKETKAADGYSGTRP